MRKTLFICALQALAAPAFASDAKTDAVMNALTSELDRSFGVLKNAEKTPLYFLGYEVIDTKQYSASSFMGATDSENDSERRRLDIDARFNDFKLDNTHQIKGDNSFNSQTNYTQFVPVENDENSIRARVWEHTDAAFKRAYEAFTKVKMNKAITATEEDPSPDFSPAKAEVFYETAEFPSFDKAAWKARLNKLTEKFSPHAFIYQGQAWLRITSDNRYIVNSEGTRVKTGNTYVNMGYSITSRTDDGMELERDMQYHAATPAELPSDEVVLKDIERSITELKALKSAPLVDPFSGPAILNARPAGVYFHEIIGHRLEGHRQKLEDSGQTFAKKLNQKITADFITLYDDPNLKSFNGTVLRGHYTYDDEGVKAQRVNLIENGVLKGFLMSRSPIRDFASSNGHGRKSVGFQVVSRMGNTMVEASKTVPYPKLREMLIEECKKQGKPFGLVFSDISGGFTFTGRGSGQSFKVLPLLVYRVYADGRPDEIVRGVDIVGTPIANFSKIIAAADDPAVFNGTCGAESGWVPVSAVAPSILMSEIEVEKSKKSQEKPPVLEPPLHDK
ncbi:MAG: metallopeptidase TldD-related protein [Elusimicrobia bacterium]|nr:metallopeptidase TldD-related protein [Elusimicrobiota bacterium]